MALLLLKYRNLHFMNKKQTEEERLKKLLNVSKVSVGKTWRKKYETSTSTNKRRNKKGS
jgi:hypothetical protein